MFRKSIGAAILLTALLAGTLDISAAIINYMIQGGQQPESVLKYIASGVFGSRAFQGDPLMPYWGILFHYIIAFLFTLFYFVIYPFLPSFKNNIPLSAFIYGIIVWIVMNKIIVPFSHTPPLPFVLWKTLVQLGILIICIGLPISWLAKKHYLYRK